MSAILERVKPKVQPPLNFYDTRIVNKNEPRWVWTAGDVIVPRRKADIEWLRAGGDEVSCPCLMRYGKGFIPRGYSAILELGGDLMPIEHFGDLKSRVWSSQALNPELSAKALAFLPVYPGDGLSQLRAYAMNDASTGTRRGIDEDSALTGKTWDECHNAEGTGILDVIERDMFGDGIEPTLQGLVEQIRHLDTTETRIDVGKLKDDRLRIADEFQQWALVRLGEENSLLKVGSVNNGQWTYTYSPLGEMLLLQLEMTRQDQPMTEMSKLNSDLVRNLVSMTQMNQANQTPPPAIDYTEFERRMEEKFAALTAAKEQGEREMAELREQLAKATVVEPEVKMWTCDECGEELKATGKGFHIARHRKDAGSVGEPPTE